MSQSGFIDQQDWVDATQSANIPIGQVPFTNAGDSVNLTVPQNVHSIRLYKVGGSAGFLVDVTGTQSGLVYTGTLSPGNLLGAVIPFSDVAMDQQITVNVHAGSGAGTLYVVGTSDPAVVKIYNPEGITVVNAFTVNGSSNAQSSSGSVTIFSVPAQVTYHLVSVILSVLGGTAASQASVAAGATELLNLYVAANGVSSEVLTFPNGFVVSGSLSPTPITLAPPGAGGQAHATVHYITA